MLECLIAAERHYCNEWVIRGRGRSISTLTFGYLEYTIHVSIVSQNIMRLVRKSESIIHTSPS